MKITIDDHYVIAIHEALDDLFDRLAVSTVQRKDYKEKFAKKMGEVLGQCIIKEIEAKIK